MKLEELVNQLKATTDPLCHEAADMLVQLYERYQELGRSYDAMSADIVKLYEAYREEKRSKDGKD